MLLRRRGHQLAQQLRESTGATTRILLTTRQIHQHRVSQIGPGRTCRERPLHGTATGHLGEGEGFADQGVVRHHGSRWPGQQTQIGFDIDHQALLFAQAHRIALGFAAGTVDQNRQRCREVSTRFRGLARCKRHGVKRPSLRHTHRLVGVLGSGTLIHRVRHALGIRLPAHAQLGDHPIGVTGTHPTQQLRIGTQALAHLGEHLVRLGVATLGRQCPAEGAPGPRQLDRFLRRAGLFEAAQGLFCQRCGFGIPPLLGDDPRQQIDALRRIHRGAAHALQGMPQGLPGVDLRLGQLVLLQQRARQQTLHHLAEMRRRTGPGFVIATPLQQLRMDRDVLLGKLQPAAKRRLGLGQLAVGAQHLAARPFQLRLPGVLVVVPITPLTQPHQDGLRVAQGLRGTGTVTQLRQLPGTLLIGGQQLSVLVVGRRAYGRFRRSRGIEQITPLMLRRRQLAEYPRQIAAHGTRRVVRRQAQIGNLLTDAPDHAGGPAPLPVKVEQRLALFGHRWFGIRLGERLGRDRRIGFVVIQQAHDIRRTAGWGCHRARPARRRRSDRLCNSRWHAQQRCRQQRQQRVIKFCSFRHRVPHRFPSRLLPRQTAC